MSADEGAAEFERIAATHPRCFWLDGGGAREWSRQRSIIGWLEPDDVSLTYDAARREVTRHAGGRAEVVGDDPFAALEAELAAGSPSDQWFGYFGYAARPDLPAESDPDLPDAVWMRPSNVRMYEHRVAEGGVDGGGPDDPTVAEPLRHARRDGSGSVGGFAPRVSPAMLPGSSGPPPTPPSEPVAGERAPSPASPPSIYTAAFEVVQEHLHAGNSYEVNLTHRLVVDSDLAPAAAYLRLREINPAPYAGYLQHDVPGARAHLLSSSPERYALITADRVLETKPIKGTTQRGRTDAEDEAARHQLATDPKFRSENLMIVDLLRNDLSLVCEVGSVDVPELMQVESYASVHQLVSTVRGQLREDVSTVAALRSLFPAGSMTGAPKLRTMQIIAAVEGSPRGAYAGAFGWVAGDGRADLGVVIRSLMTTGDGRYVVGTGGGITVDSDAEEEYAETRWKAERLLRSITPTP